MGISDQQRINQRETLSDPGTGGSNCDGGICVPNDPKQELRELRSRQSSGSTVETFDDVYRFSSTDQSVPRPTTGRSTNDGATPPHGRPSGPPSDTRVYYDSRRPASNLPDVTLTQSDTNGDGKPDNLKFSVKRPITDLNSPAGSHPVYPIIFPKPSSFAPGRRLEADPTEIELPQRTPRPKSDIYPLPNGPTPGLLSPFSAYRAPFGSGPRVTDSDIPILRPAQTGPDRSGSSAPRQGEANAGRSRIHEFPPTSRPDVGAVPPPPRPGEFVPAPPRPGELVPPPPRPGEFVPSQRRSSESVPPPPPEYWVEFQQKLHEPVDSNRVRHDSGDHAGPGSLRRHREREEQNANPERPTRPYPNGSPSYTIENFDPPSERVAPSRREVRPNPEGRSNPAERPTPHRPDERTTPSDRQQPRAGDGKVTEAGPRELRDALQTSTRPVVVEVYMDGCHGCQAIDPHIRNLAAQYNGKADVYRVNINQLAQDPELRSQLSSRQVPATFIFDQGKLVSREIGVRDAQFFGRQIDRALQQHPRSDTPNAVNPPENRRNNDNPDSEEKREKHGLGARFERIKEKIHRFTHFGEREKEEAFNPTNDEVRTLDLINQVRARNGLGPVVQDPRLQLIARRHTEYQIRHGMRHDEATPGWQNVSQRMQQVGLQGWRENAAIGSFTPEKLVQMWWNSPGHRAALLGQGNIAAVAIRGGSATFNLTTDPEMGRY